MLCPGSLQPCMDSPPAGATRPTDWARAHTDMLGVRYASEFARRMDRTSACGNHRQAGPARATAASRAASRITKASLTKHVTRWAPPLPVEFHLDCHFRILRPLNIQAVAAQTFHHLLADRQARFPVSRAAVVEVQ